MHINDETIEQAQELVSKFGGLSDDALVVEIAKSISEAKKNGSYNKTEIINTLKDFENVLGTERVSKILDMLEKAERM